MQHSLIFTDENFVFNSHLSPTNILKTNSIQKLTTHGLSTQFVTEMLHNYKDEDSCVDFATWVDFCFSKVETWAVTWAFVTLDLDYPQTSGETPHFVQYLQLMLSLKGHDLVLMYRNFAVTQSLSKCKDLKHAFHSQREMYTSHDIIELNTKRWITVV